MIRNAKLHTKGPVSSQRLPEMTREESVPSRAHYLTLCSFTAVACAPIVVLGFLAIPQTLEPVP